MLMADDTFNWPHSEFLASGDADEDDDGMSIDIGALFYILEESLLENSQVGLSGGNILQEIPGPDIDIKQTSQPRSDTSSGPATENFDHKSQSIGAFSTQDCANEDSTGHSFNYFYNTHCPRYEEIIPDRKNEMEEPRDWSGGSSSKIELIACGGNSNYISAMSGFDTNFDRRNNKSDGRNFISPTMTDNSLSNCKERYIDKSPSLQPPTRERSYLSRNMCIKDEKADELTGPSMMHTSVGFLGEAIKLKCSYGNNENLFIEKDAKHPLSARFPFITRQRDIDFLQDEKEITLLSKLPRNTEPCISPDNQIGCIVNEYEGKLIPSTSMGYDFPKVGPESLQSDSSDTKSFKDDNSEHIVTDQSIALRKSIVNNCTYTQGKISLY